MGKDSLLDLQMKIEPPSSVCQAANLASKQALKENRYTVGLFRFYCFFVRVCVFGGEWDAFFPKTPANSESNKFQQQIRKAETKLSALLTDYATVEAADRVGSVDIVFSWQLP